MLMEQNTFSGVDIVFVYFPVYEIYQALRQDK